MTPEEVFLIEKAAATLMPRGNYRGERLEDVPEEYLRWVVEEWDDWELVDLCLVELKTRE